MTTVAHLRSFYAMARTVVWVEDIISRDYLGKVWGDPPAIAFLIAGSGPSVRTVVDTAKREGINHVFGILDRDLGETNRPKWNSPDTRTFKLPRHEIENYLLDTAAVMGCGFNTLRRSAADIDDRMQRLAERQIAWLACCRVLTQIRSAAVADFPEHPAIETIPAATDAERHIVGLPWLSAVGGKLAGWTSPGVVSSALGAADAQYRTAFVRGEWRQDVAGKQLFRQLSEYVYRPRRTGGSPDNDLAQAIGEWQFSNDCVPADLIDLKVALDRRGPP